MKTRLTEHKRATTKGDISNQTSEYHRKTEHDIDWVSAECVIHSTNYYQRITLESDINYFIENVSLRLYADDTTEYFADHSPMVLEFTINNEMSTLAEWFASNYLSINSTKTQALAIGPSNYNYNFELNDIPIEMKDSLEILGLTIDRMLTFKDHIKQQLVKRAYAKAGALRRIRRFLPPDVMTRLSKRLFSHIWNIVVRFLLASQRHNPINWRMQIFTLLDLF